ncbi:hypothetical protein HY412_02260 [Candidatus Kaiserbacteria bacterium]|nr:hypothetical protein [Candidatus Kaiserbacteria bacterium]
MQKNTEIARWTLQKIGFSESEVSLYMAALETGPSNVARLGQRAGLSRQMVYLLIPGLLEKGLLSEFRKGQKVLYRALSPSLLRGITERITKEVESIIPLLQTRAVEHEAIPLLTVYENSTAMREWYVRFMKEAKAEEELLVYSSGNFSHWYDLDPKFYDKYLAFSDRKGIHSKIILPDTTEAHEYQKKIGTSAREARYSPALSGELVEKWMWRNQLCYQTIRASATNLIVVESKAIAEMERNLFKTVWVTAISSA